MTLQRKAEILDKIMSIFASCEINGITLFGEDEELERFLISELGLTDQEIRQFGFELYV